MVSISWYILQFTWRYGIKCGWFVMAIDKGKSGGNECSRQFNHIYDYVG